MERARKKSNSLLLESMEQESIIWGNNEEKPIIMLLFQSSQTLEKCDSKRHARPAAACPGKRELVLAYYPIYSQLIGYDMSSHFS